MQPARCAHSDSSGCAAPSRRTAPCRRFFLEASRMQRRCQFHASSARRRRLEILRSSIRSREVRERTGPWNATASWLGGWKCLYVGALVPKNNSTMPSAWIISTSWPAGFRLRVSTLATIPGSRIWPRQPVFRWWRSSVPTDPAVWAPRGERVRVVSGNLDDISVDQILKVCGNL